MLERSTVLCYWKVEIVVNWLSILRLLAAL